MFIVVVEDDRGALVSEHALSDGQLNIGREANNEIVLQSEAISRRHALLSLENDRIVLTDLDSQNGVLVDEQRIMVPTVITSSSQIRLGPYQISIESTESHDPEAGFKTAILRPEQAHAKLTLLNGAQAGRELLLFDPITCIGRTDENDVTLADTSVSRHHARLRRQRNGAYVLTDLDSANGTYVNNRRVNPSATCWLGERLRFGNVECALFDPQGKGVIAARRPNHYLLLTLAVLVAAGLGAAISLLL